MRKITLFACLLVAIFASAQFSGSGFYRVRNAYTNRCICIKGTTYEKSTYPYAFWSCIQMQADSIPVTDPGSIIYIPDMGETSLCAQGVSTYTLTGLYLTIDTAKVREGGKPSYLAKTKYDNIRCIFRDYGVGLSAGTLEFTESRWWIEPVNEGSIDTSFMAVKPLNETVVDADGYYWSTILCDFPFVLPLDGGVEGVYTVKEIKMGSDSLYYAAPVKVYGQGDTVPAATPVLLRCTSPYASGNKIIPVGDIANHTDMPIANDMLVGNYFSSFINHASFTDRTVFKEYIAELATPVSSDYLVLGVDDEGRLGFYPLSEESYMPANTAWLAVGDLEGVTEVYLGEAPVEEPVVILGDVDGDNTLTVNDVTRLIAYVVSYTGKDEGNSSDVVINLEAADINGDGLVNITDVIRLVAIVIEQ